jgi:REP element-mobilizing transposase RayT
MADHETRPAQHRLRRGRLSEAGRPYILTTVTQNRETIFTDLRAARLVVQALKHQHQSARADSLAYVLMPDHLHWLLALPEGSALGELMESVKGYTARQINELRGTSGARIWQPGFHDRALRKEDDLRQAARYLVANPLRAGLVSAIGDYPHWDARWLEPGTEVARSLD